MSTRIARDTIPLLQKHFPQAFPPPPGKPVCLMIGIQDRLNEWAQQQGLEDGAIRKTLAAYCAKLTYQQALAGDGAMRVDLHGKPVEAVAPEAQAVAQQRVDQAVALHKAKAKAKRERGRAEARARSEKAARLKAEAEKKAATVAKKAKAPTTQAKAKKKTGTQPVVVVKKRRRIAPE